jgi:type I restriction enzyme S subunit
MTRAWSTAPLGELVEIQKGVSYKGAYLDQPGPSLLGLGVVQPGGGYREGKERSYGGPFKPQHEVRPGDLFVALTDLTQEGLVLGSPVIVPRSVPLGLVTHHVATLRLKAGAPLEPRFLYDALCADASRGQFRGMATGTTVRAVSPSDAGRVTIPLPPVPEQRRIAAILGAIDEKLALNHRGTRTLEELAQATFKAWFVNFDDYDPADLKDSEIGPIPRAWTIGGPDALVDFDPKVLLKKGIAATYVDMNALPTAGPAVAEWVHRPYAGGARFQQGDTLLARITPCLENGKSALVDFLNQDEVAYGSTEFIVLRPKAGVPRAWPYCLVRHEPFRAHAIANLTGSSGRQRVGAVALAGYRLAIPPPELLERFGQTTDPLFQRITSNTRESRILRELRDTLLPRLVCGELRVPEAEAAVEEAR